MQTFREETPLHAPTVFDFDPNSASWALESQFPFVGDCSGTPGRDLVSLFCFVWLGEC